MNLLKLSFREHRNLVIPLLLVLACTQMAFLKELPGLHRVHLHTAIAWFCEAMLLLGIASALIGISSAFPEKVKREALIGTGLLATTLSLTIQFSVWETIGKYTMFQSLHPTQTFSELQDK